MDEKSHPKGYNPNSLKNLRPVKPGQVLNPEGSRGKNSLKNQIRAASQKTWCDLINILGFADPAEVQEYVNQPGVGLIPRGIAKAVIKASEEGDWYTLKDMVESIIGKPKLEFDINVTVGNTPEEIEERRLRVQERLKQIYLLDGR